MDSQCPCDAQRATSVRDSKAATGANRACQWPLDDLRQITEESLKGMVHSRLCGQRNPRDGEYDVSFFFPDPSMARRIRIASTFTLTVFHRGKADTLEIERDQMKAGWNYLGDTNLQKGKKP